MTTNELKQDDTTSLQDYILELTADKVLPENESDAREAERKRMQSGAWPAEIDEETYNWFLEVLPPRFMQGSCFCFAEGIAPFDLFWKKNGCYFVRTLDWHQTRNICRLADTPVYE